MNSCGTSTQVVAQALSFMVKQFGEVGLDGPSKHSVGDPDAANFRNVYATIKFLADRCDHIT